MADKDTLKSHYEALFTDDGYVALCRMTLPTEELEGKRILDLGCRRGKGVFKLSSLAGPEGFVVGVDWNESLLDEARAASPAACAKNGLPEPNFEFHFAYPEDLTQAQIDNQGIDVIYLNSAFNLVFDRQQVISELFRVLAPGGMLILETVVADAARDEEVLAQARALGNPIQAAPGTGDVIRTLMMAGFAQVEYLLVEDELDPGKGATEDVAAPVVDSAEEVTFSMVAFHARKV